MSSSITLLCNQCWSELSHIYYVTRCNHVFCERDATDHFSRELKCPACQRDLQESDIHEIRLPLASRDTHYNQGFTMKDAFNSFYTSMSFLLFQATLQKKWIQYKHSHVEKKLKEVQDQWSIREEEIKNIEDKAQHTIMELREDVIRKEQEIRALREHYAEKSNEVQALRTALDQMRFGSGRDTTPVPASITFEQGPQRFPPHHHHQRLQSPPHSASSRSGRAGSMSSSRPAFLAKTAPSYGNRLGTPSIPSRTPPRQQHHGSSSMFTPQQHTSVSRTPPFATASNSVAKPPQDRAEQSTARRPLTPSFLKRRKSGIVSSSSNLLFSPPTRKSGA